MTLSDQFHKLLAEEHERPEAIREAAELVINAPDSSERDGLLALMYHEGIGVGIDLDLCFKLAETSALNGHDGLGYFLTGYMYDNGEAPGQIENRTGQLYDQRDAKRFYEICSTIDSRWREEAIIWLGDYYMDPARGGKQEMAVEYYESIANNNAKAACRLSDYYWDLIDIEQPLENQDLAARLFKWTSIAAEKYTDEYTYRLGTLYTCGVGCEKDSDRAIDLYVEAYENGDWRGAQAVAAILADFLDCTPELSAEERDDIESEIERWGQLSEEMRRHNPL